MKISTNLITIAAIISCLFNSSNSFAQQSNSVFPNSKCTVRQLIGVNPESGVEEWVSNFAWSDLDCKKYYVSASVEDFIRSQEKIGFGLDSSRNYGNQAAVINQFSRLRQMGFNGYAVIVYDNTYDQETKSYNKDKVYQLLNLSPDNKPDYFKNEKLKIEVIEATEFKRRLLSKEIKPIPLFFGYGWDASTISIEYSPYHIKNEWYDTKLYINGSQSSKRSIRQNNTGSKSLIIPIATFNQAETYLTFDSDGQKLLKDMPALQTFINIIKKQSANVMPIYGWSTRDYPHNLINFILGARYAQLNGGDDLKKPLVITTFYPLAEENITQIKAIINDGSNKLGDNAIPIQLQQAIQASSINNNFSVIHISDSDAVEKLSQLQANHIYLLVLQPLPKVVFDGLFTFNQNNILPPVREGASSYTSLINSDRPHLHCVIWPMDEKYKWEINLGLANERLKDRLFNLDINICGENMSAWERYPISQGIGEYIIEAHNPNSELSTYFSQLKNWALLIENDRIRFGIFEAMELLNTHQKSKK